MARVISDIGTENTKRHPAIVGLSEVENKQVIIPSKWFGVSNSHLNTNDLYCNKWIKL